MPLTSVKNSSTFSPRHIMVAVVALATLVMVLANCSQPASAGVTATPGPTARNASIYSEISFRGVRPSRSGKITIRGSRSGNHGFTRKAHADNRGFSLILKRSLEASESVAVNTRLKIYGASRGSYRFRVENLRLKRSTRVPQVTRKATGQPGYVTRPGLRIPRMKISKQLSQAGKQPLFVGSKDAGNMIYAADGEPIWFRPGSTTDFRRQVWRGKPVLTWAEIPTKGSGLKRNSYMIADTNYRIIRKVVPGNGYPADTHEFRLTRRGTAFVTAYRVRIRDLRRFGQSHRGLALDSIAQELDLKTGRVIWEWHSLDHVPVSETYAKKPRKSGKPFDYFHINSIIDTPDGNVMISGRSTSTVYKVSRRTGKVLWRLGGKRSNFRMGKGARFSWQHDSQPLSGGRVSLFDNANSPVATRPSRSQSRGLILKLNGKKKTATLVRQFQNPERPLASTQANVQALPGGNFLVGWGAVPLISEHGPHGSLLFNARVHGIGTYYRAYRNAWHGRPTGKPALVARAAGGNKTRVWVSHNGDTETTIWKVYSGPNKTGLKHVADRARKGFETETVVPGAARYIEVKGFTSNGKSTGHSRVVTRGS